MGLRTKVVTNRKDTVTDIREGSRPRPRPCYRADRTGTFSPSGLRMLPGTHGFFEPECGCQQRHLGVDTRRPGLRHQREQLATDSAVSVIRAGAPALGPSAPGPSRPNGTPSSTDGSAWPAASIPSRSVLTRFSQHVDPVALSVPHHVRADYRRQTVSAAAGRRACSWPCPGLAGTPQDALTLSN